MIYHCMLNSDSYSLFHCELFNKDKASHVVTHYSTCSRLVDVIENITAVVRVRQLWVVKKCVRNVKMLGDHQQMTASEENILLSIF